MTLKLDTVIRLFLFRKSMKILFDCTNCSCSMLFCICNDKLLRFSIPILDSLLVLCSMMLFPFGVILGELVTVFNTFRILIIVGYLT